MANRKLQNASKRKLQDQARRVRNDLYRQHILEAAERVFAERGFENAKLQEISALAGVSMGTIYAIFPGKDDLFRAILDDRGHELLQIAQASAARQGDAREALEALLEAYIDYFVAHPHFLRMHLRLGTSWVLGPSQNTGKQVQLWSDIHAQQTQIFRRGIAEGIFVDEDPGFLAKVFSAMDQVLLADWVAAGMKADRTCLAERLRSLVHRVFCRPD